MSKQIDDRTFEFLNIAYGRHVAEFLDDPTGMFGGFDPVPIANHYEYLVAIGEDIALGLGPKRDESFFWQTVMSEERTDYEIARLKEYLEQAKCAK